MKLGAALPSYRTFALEELKEATNNFDTSTLMDETSNRQVSIPINSYVKYIFISTMKIKSSYSGERVFV